MVAESEEETEGEQDVEAGGAEAGGQGQEEIEWMVRLVVDSAYGLLVFSQNPVSNEHAFDILFSSAP